MIYIFRTPFKTAKGRIIPAGDAVFVDDPDATDEIALEVKRRLSESDNKEEKKTKKNTKI